MKIVIPVDEKNINTKISQSFGRASYFLIYNENDKTTEFIKNESMSSQGGAGIKAAQLMVDLKIDAIITPRCGQNAAEVLNMANIKIYESDNNIAIENIKLYEQDKLFSQWLNETIVAIYNQVKEKLEQGFKEKVTLDIYQNPLFVENYINEVMADTLGYAGTEIIRRTIGDSKVKEISTAPLGEKRVAMERSLLQLGESLITKRYELTTGEEVIEAFKLIKE